MDTQVCLTSKQAPLSPTKFAVMHDVPYHEAVSTLNLATLATCLDIAFTITTVVHFGANPGPAYWEAIKWIFHYLASTCDLCLSYSETWHVLEGYTDTDSSMAKDQCAISGYMFLIDGGAMLWSSKQQCYRHDGNPEWYK